MPILLPLKMVVRVGLAPTVFLVWQIYSLLRSLLSHLTIKLVGVDGFGPSNAGVSDQCVNQLRHTPIEIWCRERDLNPQPRDYDSLAPPLCYPDINGRDGGIRTHTVHALNVSPAANWATPPLYRVMLCIM